MIEAVLDIKLLAPHEWPLLRSTRLSALRDSPRAFASHYLIESRWHEHEWRYRLATARWVVAVEAGLGIGLAALADGEPSHEEPHLESVWVAPSHRRRGVFRSLVDAIADEARALRLRELLLWVLEENVDAETAYEHVGFTPTGDRQLGPDRRRWERRYRRPL